MSLADVGFRPGTWARSRLDPFDRLVPYAFIHTSACGESCQLRSVFCSSFASIDTWTKRKRSDAELSLKARGYCYLNVTLNR